MTPKRWMGVGLVWLGVIAALGGLYMVARGVIIDEIRQHAKGVAIAVAAGIDAADLNRVHTPEDMETTEFRRVQAFLDRVSKSNVDVQYIYTMRRSLEPGAAITDYVFVVDESPRDRDGDGVISEEEMSEEPGEPYDAALWPKLVEAWDRATADPRIQPDPPYPDLISGYAPVRDAEGQTVGIVGVDIIADTVYGKLRGVQVAFSVVALLFIGLITKVVSLHYQQQESFERVTRLGEELAERNELLKVTNEELAEHNRRMEQDLKLAQSVQLGFLPNEFPRQDRLQFDKFYLTSDLLGGDLFDVFSLDHDHVAIYMADVSGHGVSAALISGLLKMAVASVRGQRSPVGDAMRSALFDPDQVLHALNDMLLKEIPECDFITMIYAVMDVKSNHLRIANAGHPYPICYQPGTRQVSLWTIPGGPALGILEDQAYPVSEKEVQVGDRILFYTDGLTEAMSQENEEFGEARLLEMIREHGPREPVDILDAIRLAVDVHRNGEPVSDDFSMLIAEIRPDGVRT